MNAKGILISGDWYSDSLSSSQPQRSAVTTAHVCANLLRLGPQQAAFLCCTHLCWTTLFGAASDSSRWCGMLLHGWSPTYQTAVLGFSVFNWIASVRFMQNVGAQEPLWIWAQKNLKMYQYKLIITYERVNISGVEGNCPFSSFLPSCLIRTAQRISKLQHFNYGVQNTAL